MRQRITRVLAQTMTLLGDKGLIWLALASYAADQARRFDWFLLAVALMAVLYGLVDLVLKPWFGRRRDAQPSANQPLQKSPYRFPSGHAASAAMALVFLIDKLSQTFWWVSLGLAALILLSRLWLREHRWQDLIGGIVVGGLVGWVGLGLT